MAYGDISFELGGRQATVATNLVFDKTVAGGHANVGKAISMNSSGQAANSTAAGQAVIGQLREVTKDLTATVQFSGWAWLPYTGVTSAALQKRIVTGATAGEIQVADMAVAAQAAVAGHKIWAIRTNEALVLFDGAVS